MYLNIELRAKEYRMSDDFYSFGLGFNPENHPLAHETYLMETLDTRIHQCFQEIKFGLTLLNGQYPSEGELATDLINRIQNEYEISTSSTSHYPREKLLLVYNILFDQWIKKPLKIGLSEGWFSKTHEGLINMKPYYQNQKKC